MTIERLRHRFTDAGRWLLLAMTVLWTAGPIAVIFLSSFKQSRDIFSYKPVLFFSPVADGYRSLVENWPGFFASLADSATVTIGSALLVVLTCLPAAYGYSRMRTRRLSSTAFFLIGVRMFPPIVITIPLYPIFRNVGLIDTPIALVLIYAAFQVSLSTMLLKTFIDGIGPEIEEQAWIDGCTRSQGFIRILLPLLAPGIIAAVIFVCVFAWNDFVFAFLLTGTRTKTAPIMISELLGGIGEGVTDWNTVFAAATIQIMPILVFIWLIQKRLVSGFTLGSVKG